MATLEVPGHAAQEQEAFAAARHHFPPCGGSGNSFAAARPHFPKSGGSGYCLQSPSGLLLRHGRSTPTRIQSIRGPSNELDQGQSKRSCRDSREGRGRWSRRWSRLRRQLRSRRSQRSRQTYTSPISAPREGSVKVYENLLSCVLVVCSCICSRYCWLSYATSRVVCGVGPQIFVVSFCKF